MQKKEAKMSSNLKKASKGEQLEGMKIFSGENMRLSVMSFNKAC